MLRRLTCIGSNFLVLAWAERCNATTSTQRIPTIAINNIATLVINTTARYLNQRSLVTKDRVIPHMGRCPTAKLTYPRYLNLVDIDSMSS